MFFCGGFIWTFLGADVHFLGGGGGDIATVSPSNSTNMSMVGVGAGNLGLDFAEDTSLVTWRNAPNVDCLCPGSHTGL